MTNWSEQYTLGLDLIDEQHKGFFELYETACKELRENEHVQADRIVQQLEDYLHTHFRDEEHLMRLARYPDMDKHWEMHHFFLLKVTEMKLEVAYQNPMVAEKLILFMKKWFLNHILETDKAYLQSVKAYLSQQH